MANLHLLESVTDTINTSIIVEDNGTLLVVDGGYMTEAPCMYEHLKRLGGHVTAWFLTHPHDDHVECFYEILEKHPDIQVDTVCCHFPSKAFAAEHEPMQKGMSMSELYDRFEVLTAQRVARVLTVERGDVLSFGGWTVRVLRTPDESITENPINNSSAVFRFEKGKNSILILGDLGVAGGKQLLETTAPELLRADFCQMAHHGQGGVSREVYEAIKPRFPIWCTPTWLWENRGPGGYDTGRYQTVIVRGWISALRCVEKHYRMIDGTQTIPLSES